jgi:butyryl-CoA dehydrogenase
MEMQSNELRKLAEQARQADEEPVWPAASWKILQTIGACGWTIPKTQGGSELGLVELLERYESLAEACLTSAFLLSQRDAAVRRIREHGTETWRPANASPPLDWRN